MQRSHVIHHEKREQDLQSHTPSTPGQHTDAPSNDPSRAGQLMHAMGEVEPEEGLYVPAGHGKQSLVTLDEPDAGLYVPAGHEYAIPATQYWPGGQSVPFATIEPAMHKPPA